MVYCCKYFRGPAAAAAGLKTGQCFFSRPWTPPKPLHWRIGRTAGPLSACLRSSLKACRKSASQSRRLGGGLFLQVFKDKRAIDVYLLANLRIQVFGK